MIGLLVSKYRILEEIGRGSMGIVFKAENPLDGRNVAIKILAEKLINDPEMLQRFEREGGAASALNHPNICRVFESGNWQGRPYLVMELLTGQSLDQLLKSGPVPAAQLIDIADGVCRALEAAHAIGVVHRDIKPGNIFLTGTGEVKVLDFGLAKVTRPSTPMGDDAPTAVMTRRGIVLGTFAYMSPEQICCEPLDGRTDLFSLGVVLYELATGKLPIRGAEVEALPAGLGPILAKLMAPDASLRYQTAAEARRAVRSGPASPEPDRSAPAAGWLTKVFRR